MEFVKTIKKFQRIKERDILKNNELFLFSPNWTKKDNDEAIELFNRQCDAEGFGDLKIEIKENEND